MSRLRPPKKTAPLERGLRDLATEGGSSPRTRLSTLLAHPRDYPEQAELFVRYAASLHEPDIALQVDCLWQVLWETIEGLLLRHPLHGRALRAVFASNSDPRYAGSEAGRLPVGVAARLQAAQERGEFLEEARTPRREDVRAARTLQRYWTDGVYVLARRLEERLESLARAPAGWAPYRTSSRQQVTLERPPADAQAIVVEKMVATYRMVGRTVSSALSERWIAAREDGVDRYVAQVWTPGVREVDTPVVTPRLNCVARPLRSTGDGYGGLTHEVALLFPRPLTMGERHFFASEVTSQANEVPIAEVQVTTYGISAGGLTMRVQFDLDQLPVAAWWFAECFESQRLVQPPEGDPRRLSWTGLGYLEYNFPQYGRTMHRYGIGWAWA